MSDTLVLTHAMPIDVHTRLTASELAVARMIADSYSNEDMSRARGTAVATIANQVGTMYRKLGVQCRRECVLRLYGGRLVPIDRQVLSAIDQLATHRPLE